MVICLRHLCIIYSSPNENECTAVSNLLKLQIRPTGLRFEHTYTCIPVYSTEVIRRTEARSHEPGTIGLARSLIHIN